MNKLLALVLFGMFAGMSYSADTLVVQIQEVQSEVHKDTVGYFFDTGVSATFIEDIKDSVEIYHPKVLNLWIYTGGGDPMAAINLYKWLKNHNVKIRTFVSSMAASAGVLLFVWGDERYIDEFGLLFVHQVSTWIFLEKYNPRSSESMAISLKTIQEDIEDFICYRTGISKEKLHLWMLEEKWFRGEKAVEAGFATGMLGDDGKPIHKPYAVESNDLP